ncbi:hypothetical protein PVAND_011205 [Polypedilum vanderplanki]|uniref:Vps16 C-terminal domain-containing protein n=1 Tax=Polypedilum vanderplanki TaxID=319348 RepID=A0A9J6CIL0_POLVA|nr:hypothetical protein PVAND_011205 [Polypedilum vanderplanki]
MEDDYWNVSLSKSFSFDDDIDEKVLDDNVSEISTKSIVPITFVLSENDLQLIIDEEIHSNDAIIPKGLTLEEEVKFLRRKINEFQYSEPSLTIAKILLQKPCSLDCYKSINDKEKLLDEAISSGNGDAILQVVLFLKNTLKPILFQKLLANRSEAVEHYLNYLSTTMKICEAVDILTMLDRQQEAIMLQFKTIVQSKNTVQKLDKLKIFIQPTSSSINPFLMTQMRYYINLLELQINERLYFQPHDVLDKSLLETLYFACEKFQKFSDPLTSQNDTNPFKMIEQYNITSAQFEWIALNQRARAQAWRDIETLFEKKTSVLKKKNFTINISLEVVILKLHQLKAPQAVLNSFLQHIEDPERRLTLSKRVGAITSIIDSLTLLKDKNSLEDFKNTLPSGTAEFFYTEKAITSLSNSSTKSLLGLRKNSSTTS